MSVDHDPPGHRQALVIADDSGHYFVLARPLIDQAPERTSPPERREADRPARAREADQPARAAAVTPGGPCVG